MKDLGKYLFVTVSCVAGLLLDQISKFLIVGAVRENQEIPVIPGFFDLTLRYNRGAAFSLFESKPAFFFFTISFIAIGALLYFITQVDRAEKGQIIALGAVLGGALGNLVDRIRMGAVVDFLLAHYKSFSWPAFNVADSLIVVGVFVFLYFNMRQSRAENPKAG